MAAALIPAVGIVRQVVVLAEVRDVVVVEIDAVDELARVRVVGQERLLPVEDEVLVAVDVADAVRVLVQPG